MRVGLGFHLHFSVLNEARTFSSVGWPCSHSNVHSNLFLSIPQGCLVCGLVLLMHGLSPLSSAHTANIVPRSAHCLFIFPTVSFDTPRS